MLHSKSCSHSRVYKWTIWNAPEAASTSSQVTSIPTEQCMIGIWWWQSLNSEEIITDQLSEERRALQHPWNGNKASLDGCWACSEWSWGKESWWLPDCDCLICSSQMCTRSSVTLVLCRIRAPWTLASEPKYHFPVNYKNKQTKKPLPLLKSSIAHSQYSVRIALAFRSWLLSALAAFPQPHTDAQSLDWVWSKELSSSDVYLLKLRPKLKSQLF